MAVTMERLSQTQLCFELALVYIGGSCTQKLHWWGLLLMLHLYAGDIALLRHGQLYRSQSDADEQSEEAVVEQCVVISTKFQQSGACTPHHFQADNDYVPGPLEDLEVSCCAH